MNILERLFSIRKEAAEGRAVNLAHEVERLTSEKIQLQDQLAAVMRQMETDTASAVAKLEAVQQKHKVAEEDIQHMLRMKEERMEVEKERFEVRVLADKDKEVAAIKDEYRDKMESELKTQIERSNHMYAELLGRLPNINVEMRGNVGGS